VAEKISLSVDRKPFLLQPDRPAEGELRQLREGETETELSDVWKERAREAGITMRRPRWNPNTVPAHVATMYAKEKGLDNQFHHAAARALWEDGVNLGEMPVLKEIAEKVGLDWAELSERLESGQCREEVFQESQAARDLGVGGTPTYRIGGELKFGNLSVEELQEMIRNTGGDGCVRDRGS